MQAPAPLDLEIDRGLPDALHRQIFSQLRARIASGRLPGGTRLPATRDLAARLGVTRNIIVSVYDQLAGEGVVHGSGRQGTFVAPSAGPVPPDKPPARMPLLLARFPASTSAHDAVRVDWRPGQALVHALPLDAWRSACRKAGRHLPPADFGDPQGDAGLRLAVAGWLAENRCVNVDPRQIIVTRGSGDFLTLLARALIAGGDECAIEDPGHAAVRHALGDAGARLRYIPVDDAGIDVARAFAGDRAPALVHVTPSHQYPMGGRLSVQRRRALVAAARQHGTLILENEYGCEFVYEGADYPTLYSMAPDNTVLIGTFANTVTPSMRLGFAVAPANVVARMTALIEQHHLQPSWAGQKILEELLVSGELDRHVRRALRHYTAVRKQIRARLAPYAHQICVLGDIGGLHLVLRAKHPADDKKLQQMLSAHGVRFQALDSLTAMAPCEGGILFGYGHMDTAMLDASLDLIEQCLRAQ